MGKVIANIRGSINGLRTTFIERFIPWLPSKILRNRLFRLCGVKASKDVHFYPGLSIRNPKGLVIEDGVKSWPKMFARCKMRLNHT